MVHGVRDDLFSRLLRLVLPDVEVGTRLGGLTIRGSGRSDSADTDPVLRVVVPFVVNELGSRLTFGVEDGLQLFISISNLDLRRRDDSDRGVSRHPSFL
jgi:hypothetical protein